MTVSGENTRNDYTAGGASCTFAYTFRILEATSIQVYQCGTLITTGYSVSGVDSATGGTVTFTQVPASGDTIALIHAEPYTQEVDLVDHDSSPAATIEGAFDKAVFLAQQNKELFNRTLRVGPGSPQAAAGVVVEDLQGGKLLRVGDDCDTIEMIDVDDISPGSVTVPISIANGGTNASNKATARANLDAAPLSPPYFTLGTASELTCERNLVLRGVRIEDAGCGSTYTVTTCTKGFSLVRRNASFSCTSTATAQCTQMVLSATALALESSCLDLVYVKSPNNVTNNILVDQTNKQNSRDQTAAFSAGQDIHFYWTYFNGAAVSRSSIVAPPTGPTLPACETHWAYSHSAVFDGTCLQAITVRGPMVYYDCAQSLLSLGTATCTTRISLVPKVPAIAERVELLVTVLVVGGGSSADRVLIGHRLNCLVYVLPATSSGTATTGYATSVSLPNANQEIYYRASNVGSASQVSIDVTGYSVPTGA